MNIEKSIHDLEALKRLLVMASPDKIDAAVLKGAISIIDGVVIDLSVQN